jgi:hypothetical protein
MEQNWDSPNTGITTQQIDEEIKLMMQAKEAYEKIHEEAKNLNAVYETCRERVIDILTRANKTSYKVDGLATVSRFTKFIVKTPKTNEEKAQLFKWLKDNMGAEGFLAYTTINHNSLNSLWNSEFEKATDKTAFNIPGVGAPVAEENIRVLTK